MLDKIIKYLIIVLGAIIFVAMLVYFVWDGSKIITWSSSGFVLCSVMEVGDGQITFGYVDPEDFVVPVHPTSGDTLLTIADSTATHQRWIDVLETPHKPGREATITFLHDGMVQTTTIKSRPVQRFTFLGVSALQILKLLISLSFLIIGFWAFMKRPESAGVRALVFYCFCMGATAMIVYMPMYPVMAWFQIPYQEIVNVCFFSIVFFYSAFWLLLNFVFPRPVRLIRSRPWLAYALCFAPQILVIIIGLIFGDRIDGFWELRDLVYSINVLQVLTGLILLWYRLTHPENNLEKRQTKLVFWGSGIPLIIFLIYGLFAFQVIPVYLELPTRFLFYNIAFFLLLASPISFAYAFTRYRLLEVEARLRRGTRFILYTGALLAAFFGVLYLISHILLHTFHIKSQTPTLAVALLLALGFTPVHRKLRKLIERKFYPERIKLRQMLHEFLTGTSAMPDRATLWSKLEESMKQGLGIDVVYPILRDSNQEIFRLPDGEHVPIDPNGALLQELKKNSRAMMCDECIAFEGLTLSESEKSWFTCCKVAVMLPMVVQSRLIGMLGIKFQDDHEGLESQDLDILNSLASQIALQSENLRLLEENFDKRRLEEELTNARQVQQGFLPGTLPKTPGLTVAARFLSSFEVAGDYYDVIPIKDNRTLIAVSDVSGKGAGAAMIMATVQASLRSMAKVKISLKDAISSINDLMCLNTNPEQFVTFFTAILDPINKKLTYINAGHNPPRIIRTDGTIVELNTGGPVLGVLENAEYQEETLSIQDGDLLIAFTDGVSEAMNSKGEEFGEHRIVEFIHPIVNESPATILEKLEFEVTSFRGNQPLEDDFTILLVKAGNSTVAPSNLT